MTFAGNSFNDFPANQLKKFHANTANSTKLISTHFLWLLRKNFCI